MATSARRASRFKEKLEPNGSFTFRQGYKELYNAFDPHSRVLKLWHQALFGCLLYQGFLLPFAATFAVAGVLPRSAAVYRAFYASELFFAVDFYVQLNTGYYEGGNIHRDKRKARSNYLKSFGFLLDVLAVVPLSLLLQTSGSGWPAWLEFHKVLRVWRLPSYFSNLDDVYAKHFKALKFFKMLTTTIFVAHTTACGRFAFRWHAIVSEGSQDAWLLSDSLEWKSMGAQYARALFWSVGLLTGAFEAALPRRSTEFAFTLAVLLVGLGLFMYAYATLFMLSKSESNQSVLAQARITQLRHLLSFHHVPESLQAQAVEYLKRHYTAAESNDREVIKLLCPSIAKDIQVELLQAMVGRIPLFRGCNQQFIVVLTSLLEMTSFPAHVTLFEAGDPGDYMYVVNSGVLHILVNGVKVRELRQGSFFGEVSVFSKRPRSAAVVTTSYCTLYRLSRFHTERVLEGYPHYAALIASTVDEMVNQREAATKAAKAGNTQDANANENASGGEEFMLTTLYQLSTQPPVKRQRSLRSRARKVATRTLHRSNTSRVASSSRHAEYDGGNISMNERRAEGFSRAPIVLPRAPPKVKNRQLVRSQSAFARRISSGMKLRLPRGGKAGAVESGDAIQGFYDNLSRRRTSQQEVGTVVYSALSKLLMRCGIDRSSRWRKRWLVALQLHLLLNWALSPLLLAFPLLDHPTEDHRLRAAYVVMDFLLLVDIYLNFHLSFMAGREKVLRPSRTALHYLRGAFIPDLLCMLPYKFLLLPDATSILTLHPALLRLPRLLRIWHLPGHVREWKSSFRLTNNIRLVVGTIVYLLLLHLTACLYFAVTYVEGFATNDSAWLPSIELGLYPRVDPSSGLVSFVDTTGNTNHTDAESHTVASVQYARALYFAATVVTTLGKTVEPQSTLQYVVALVLMLVGFFSLAVLIDMVQKRFTASAFEHKEFLVTRTRVQQFLRSRTAPPGVHQRVQSFLDFWWSSHRGAIAGELLNELPEAIKRPVVHSMCRPALQTLSLLAGVRPSLDALEQVFVDNIRFILYGQGEIIYRQGDYASGLFFLLEGELIIIANGGMPRSIAKGGFIGTAALNLSETSVSYAERVTAASGCILVFVSREHLDGMHKAFPTFSMALKALEKRLEGAKLARAQQDYGGGDRTGNGALRPRRKPEKMTLEMKLLQRLGLEDLVFDPEASSWGAWEFFIFILITAQYLKVTVDMTFGVGIHRIVLSEIVSLLLELCFALDLYFYSRLGYFEYGNKIMDVVLIRKRFFSSRECWLGVLALFPLYLGNWMVPSVASRCELLSLNKLLRLLRTPDKFAKLENKHLSRTLHLRLVKLIFLSFILSHLFGCIWLNFERSADSDPLAAGSNAWLPPTSLATADVVLQYSTMLFWSFGIMSGSNTGDLPRTASQCFFTVVVLVFGAFLFALVIGNLSEVVELVDADTREFNSKLSSLRHLLAHFQLPSGIREQLKTYFFFQRYHTITQEHLLEHCLPPSLLTEIRLVHLQPMIAKVGFLAGMEDSVTRMLVSQFVQVLTVKNQFAFRYGEEGSDMFFVFTGIIEVLVPSETLQRRQSNDAKLHSLGSPSRSSFRTYFPRLDPSKLPTKTQMKKVNELTSGSYFGEVSLFTSKPRTAHARSKTSCVLYKLARNSLELVFERYPDWKRKVLKIVNIQQEQQLLRNLYMEEQLDSCVTAQSCKAMLGHVDVLGDAVGTGGNSTRTTRANSTSRASSTGSFADRFASGPIRVIRAMGLRSFAGPAAVGTSGSFFTSYRAQRSASAAESLMEMRISARKPTVLWIDRLLQCTEAQSAFHVWWLKVVATATICMALLVPYRNSFDTLDRPNALPLLEHAVELICGVLFGWDIWINWNMRDGLTSMELYEHRYRDSYKKRRLWIDVLAAVPIDHFVSDFYESPVLCMNRCLKLLNFPHYMREINRCSVSYETNRARTLGVLFFVLLQWCACAYFALASAMLTGTSAVENDQDWNQWRPPSHLQTVSWSNPSAKTLLLRFFRGSFFSATVLVKRGIVFSPSESVEYTFTLFVDFLGLLVMAFMISEVASLYVSYIGNEVEFRKNHIAVDLYLERWHITGKLRARSHAFLSSLWSSHRGVNYQAIFDEVPQVIRTESILHIANQPLRAFVNTVFRPFATLHPHDRELEALTGAIAQHLKYEGYPRDECVVVEGSVAKEMYFVVKGHLISTTTAQPTQGTTAPLDVHYKKGDFFGNHGLLGYSVGTSTVRTVRACDLLSLSSEALLNVILSRSLFQTALSIAVEGYREVCTRLRAHAASAEPATSTATVQEGPETMGNSWGAVLLGILSKRREKWLEEALAAAGSEEPLADSWIVSGFKPGQEVGLVTIATPVVCEKVFENLLHLIATPESINGGISGFHKTAPQFQETLPLMSAALESPLLSPGLSTTEASDTSNKKVAS